MKLLIAYDGSRCSEAALDDLIRAGLPGKADALILTVAETWLPPPPKVENPGKDADEISDNPFLCKSQKHGAKVLSEANALAKHAHKRLNFHFPNWRIEAETDYGSPAWEIITRAERFGADLIIVGSHGRSAINRLILGSISQKVLTESSCSVRVARGKVEIDEPAPERIAIGFDGSPGAHAAVEAVAARFWRKGSEMRLIAVTDPLMPSAIGRFVPPIVNWVNEENRSERQWIEKLAENAAWILRAAGLTTTIDICAGNPKQVLVEEAEKWRADSIFVGANARGGQFERFLLGSISAAVAARAHCSVEVVRKNADNSAE